MYIVFSCISESESYCHGFPFFGDCIPISPCVFFHFCWGSVGLSESLASSFLAQVEEVSQQRLGALLHVALPLLPGGKKSTCRRRNPGDNGEYHLENRKELVGGLEHDFFTVRLSWEYIYILMINHAK